jgi:hypothetical protein
MLPDSVGLNEQLHAEELADVSEMLRETKYAVISSSADAADNRRRGRDYILFRERYILPATVAR